MGRNNDFHGGKDGTFDDTYSAYKSGYITVEQAADINPEMKSHLASKGKQNYKSSDAKVASVNTKVDNIKTGGPKGKGWRIG